VVWLKAMTKDDYNFEYGPTLKSINLTF
jgi:hypothetical protein